MSINMKGITQRITRMGPLVGLLIIVLILSISSPTFLTTGNLLNVLRQVTINALIAFGMTFVILTGGIDLSVGSILALSGALTAGMMKLSGLDPILAVLIGLIAGTLMGMVNGFFITKGKVAPFIATLATMTIFRGLTLVYTGGRPISGLGSDWFRTIGAGYLFGIPLPVIWMALMFIILYLVLKKTTFGRYVYAVGGNEEATRLAGIRVAKVKVAVYALSGFLAALAGIILTSRLDSAQPNAGLAYELDAIAAVVVGGTSLAGGRGWIVGTMIGALIIGVLNNGLNLLDVTSYYQQVVKGLVILVAVLLDRRKSA